MYYDRYNEEREALKNLMTHAEIYAKQTMNRSGAVPATLFMQGEAGPVMFVAPRMPDERSKDAFATAAKLMCVAHGATATVFVGEGWSRFAKPGEPLDATKMPSQCADRQEILMLMGETRHECNPKLMPIIRSDSGKFLGFGEAHETKADHMEGRFAQFLPVDYPDLETQRAAKEALHLAAKGKHRGRDRGIRRVRPRT